MSISSRNQFASVIAAIFCAFVTVGASVAPAIQPIAGFVA
jgi:hypothetical protein